MRSRHRQASPCPASQSIHAERSVLICTEPHQLKKHTDLARTVVSQVRATTAIERGSPPFNPHGPAAQSNKTLSEILILPETRYHLPVRPFL